MFVTDFLKRNWIDGRKAFFVAGSDAKGPMRDANLPAFAERDAATAFAADRGAGWWVSARSRGIFCAAWAAARTTTTTDGALRTGKKKGRPGLLFNGCGGGAFSRLSTPCSRPRT